MWTATLGWSALVILVIGLAAIAFGYWDMQRQVVADGKMGGAILVALGAIPVFLGVIMGMVWLAVE